MFYLILLDTVDEWLALTVSFSLFSSIFKSFSVRANDADGDGHQLSPDELQSGCMITNWRGLINQNSSKF